MYITILAHETITNRVFRTVLCQIHLSLSNIKVSVKWERVKYRIGIGGMSTAVFGFSKQRNQSDSRNSTRIYGRPLTKFSFFSLLFAGKTGKRSDVIRRVTYVVIATSYMGALRNETPEIRIFQRTARFSTAKKHFHSYSQVRNKYFTVYYGKHQMDFWKNQSA